MSDRRSLIPPPGKSARPVFFIVLVGFGLMLIGFPILMYALGLGIGSIVGITLLILLVMVGILWFTIALGRSLDRDEERLDAGEVWAEWLVPFQDHRAFVADERRTTNRRAIATALGGTAFGLLLAWLADDALLGGIMTGAFLLAGLVTYFFAGPPRHAGSDDARRVRIGPTGVHFLGRYMPFRTTLTRLRVVDIRDDAPPVMVLTVHAGRRIDQIRVPVPPEQLETAEAVAERLRLEYDL